MSNLHPCDTNLEPKRKTSPSVETSEIDQAGVCDSERLK